MQTQKTSLSIMSALGIILFISLFVIILFKDTIFEYILEYTGESSIKESEQATTETTNLILSLEKITFDTKVLSLPYVQGLTTFPSFPADSETLTNFGKSNPFVGNNNFAIEQATSSVGGLVYSVQRERNNNNAIRAVNPNR